MSENVGAALERAGAACSAIARRSSTASCAGPTRSCSDRVAGFDAALDGLGLKPGDVVGVLGLNSAAHLVAWLGDPAQRAGPQRPQLPPRAGGARVHPRRLGRPRADRRRRVPGGRPRSSPTRATPSSTSIYMGAGETPEGCLSFDELTATRRARPAGDGRSRRRSPASSTRAARPGCRRARCSRTATSSPTPSTSLIALGYRRRRLATCTRRRCSTSPTAPRRYALTWVGGRHVIIPAFEPEALAARRSQAERVTRGAAGADDDQHGRQPPGDRRARPVEPAARCIYGASPMPEELLRTAMEVHAVRLDARPTG